MDYERVKLLKQAIIDGYPPPPAPLDSVLAQRLSMPSVQDYAQDRKRIQNESWPYGSTNETNLGGVQGDPNPATALFPNVDIGLDDVGMVAGSIGQHLLKMAKMPGEALKGNAPSPNDVTDFAVDTFLGGGAFSKAIRAIPPGALGTFGGPKAKKFGGSLHEITDPAIDTVFKTGKSVTFPFQRNTEKAPNMGETYGQHIEPAGKYMTVRSKGSKPIDGFEAGDVTFSNPLVIKGDGLEWKKTLSEAYGGKTGKELSKAVANDGFDGIVTTSTLKGGQHYTSEIVDLTNFKMSDVVPGVKHGDELIGVHNLTEAKLLHSDKMGGISVPSIGVTKVGTPMKGFGDISLIAGNNLTTPARANPMFASDAYSPRYPEVSHHLSNQDKRKVEDFFAKTLDQENIWKGPKDDVGRHFAYSGDFDNQLQKYGFKGLESHDLAMATFLKEKGVLPDYKKFTKTGSHKWLVKVRDKIQKNRPEFKKWLEDLPDKIGVTPNEKIFKGYTYSGKQRYAPHTTENVVKEMKGDPRGGESFNYGLGSLRAMVTPKFKNKAGIKAKRDKVVSKEEMDNAKDALNSEIELLSTELNGLQAGSGYGPDVIMARLAETPKYGTKRALQEYYPDISDRVVSKVDKFLKKLANSPTEYFEGKPQRAVGIGEFEGALIPSKSSQSVIDTLKKSGVKKVIKYKDEADKIKKMRRFKSQMFSGAATAVGANATYDLMNGDE